MQIRITNQNALNAFKKCIFPKWKSTPKCIIIDLYPSTTSFPYDVEMGMESIMYVTLSRSSRWYSIYITEMRLLGDTSNRMRLYKDKKLYEISWD